MLVQNGGEHLFQQVPVHRHQLPVPQVRLLAVHQLVVRHQQRALVRQPQLRFEVL